MEAYAGAFVTHMAKRELAKAQATQDATWREFHSHCCHLLTDAASIACDHTEAYCTEGAEIAAKRQREAWRNSLPLVRRDETRIVRDHHFALEMNN